MKGTMDLFFASIVFIAIILIISLVGFGFISIEAFKGTCEKDLINRVNLWTEKIALPTAQTFDDRLVVGDCVDHIDAEGIFFKGDPNVRKFSLDEDQEHFWKFEFSDFPEGSKVSSREVYYNVTVYAEGKVKIYSGELPSGE